MEAIVELKEEVGVEEVDKSISNIAVILFNFILT